MDLFQSEMSLSHLQGAQTILQLYTENIGWWNLVHKHTELHRFVHAHTCLYMASNFTVSCVNCKRNAPLIKLGTQIFKFINTHKAVTLDTKNHAWDFDPVLQLYGVLSFSSKRGLTLSRQAAPNLKFWKPMFTKSPTVYPLISTVCYVRDVILS